MNKTKIVCTIGPACNNLETIKDMIRAGMNVARFNMSHGTHESQKAQMDIVKQARYELGLPVAIMLDTKGPEIRIRQFQNGSVILKQNQSFALTTERLMGDESIVSVTYDKLPTIVKEGTKILLNDGLIELAVTSVTEQIVHTTVVVGGVLSNNKSINIPSVELNMTYLSDIDKNDIKFGVEQGVDCYSISFVNSARDVEDVRRFLKECGEENPFIISKIESLKGVERMDEIIEASDGVMVARGDMGVEIPFEKLPRTQKKIIRKANECGKLTITATQMLESMIHNTRPTRAEISDVANAIYDGTSAIMLSGETSAGDHPVLTVKTMRKIADENENGVVLKNIKSAFSSPNDVTGGLGYATCALSSSLCAKAIIVSTSTGRTAISVSRFRPDSEIVALTQNEKVYYKLGMLWGVQPVMEKTFFNTDELLASARAKAKQFNYVQSGDLVIQVAGNISNNSGSDMLVVTKID